MAVQYYKSTAMLKVEIFAYCSKCGSQLDASDRDEEDRESIVVDPCEICMNAAQIETVRELQESFNDPDFKTCDTVEEMVEEAGL